MRNSRVLQNNYSIYTLLARNCDQNMPSLYGTFALSCVGLCAKKQLYVPTHETLPRRPVRDCLRKSNCMPLPMKPFRAVLRGIVCNITTVCHCPWDSSAPSRAGLSQTNRNYTQCMIFSIPLTAAISPPVPPAGPCSGAESAHGLRQRAGRRIFAVPP